MLRCLVAVSTALLLSPVLWPTAIANAAEPEIQWRVENPFRFFAEPADTELHRATLLALSEDERRQPILNAERALGERLPEGWAATVWSRTCWLVTQHRHLCPDGSDYMNPKAHAILAEVRGIDDAQTVDCAWRSGDAPKLPPLQTVL